MGAAVVDASLQLVLTRGDRRFRTRATSFLKYLRDVTSRSPKFVFRKIVSKRELELVGFASVTEDAECPRSSVSRIYVIHGWT